MKNIIFIILIQNTGLATSDGRPLVSKLPVQHIKGVQAKDEESAQVVESAAVVNPNEALPQPAYGQGHSDQELTPFSLMTNQHQTFHEADIIGDMILSTSNGSEKTMVSAWELPGEHAEQILTGVFVFASFMLALIGLKKISTLHKPAWGLQDPLMHVEVGCMSAQP